MNTMFYKKTSYLCAVNTEKHSQKAKKRLKTITYILSLNFPFLNISRQKCLGILFLQKKTKKISMKKTPYIISVLSAVFIAACADSGNDIPEINKVSPQYRQSAESDSSSKTPEKDTVADIIDTDSTICTAAGFYNQDKTTEMTEIISSTFENGIGLFSVYDFAGDSAQKIWLISPRVDLSGYDKTELVFESASDNAVYLSKDYTGGDPKKASWEKIEAEKHNDSIPTENFLELSNYRSDNVHVAFECFTNGKDSVKTADLGIYSVYLGPSRTFETPVSGYDTTDNTAETLTKLSVSLKEDGFGIFSVYDFEKYAQRDQNVWKEDKKHGAKANSSKASKSWLITPGVKLPENTEVEFLFTHCAANFSTPAKDYCALYLSSDFAGGNPENAHWKKLEPENWSDNWTWKRNTFDLTQYQSLTVHIAFEYTSKTDDKTHGTFEIDSIYIGAKETEIIPEEPVSGFNGNQIVKTAQLPFDFDFKTEKSFGDFLVYDVMRYDSKNKNIWTTGAYGITATADTISESWLLSPIFPLKNTESKYELTFTDWYKNTENPSSLYKVFVSENFSGGEITSATWTELETPFGKASKSKEITCDLSSYAGKNVTIAFQYTSTENEKGSFRIIKLGIKEIKPEEPVSGFVLESIVKTAQPPFYAAAKGGGENLGGFLVYDVKRYASKDKNIWTADNYGISASSSGECESWLISPVFSLESSKEYVLNFKNSTASKNCKALISENFSGSVLSALWTEIEMSHDQETTFDFAGSVRKNITIAFKYVSSEDENTPFRLSDFSLTEKITQKPEPEPQPQPEPEPSSNLTEGITTLTLEEFSCLETNSFAWVRGYIVGSYNKKNIFAKDGAHSNTSIIISPNPLTEDVSECIHIQLNTKVLKENVSIADNPENYGKEIIVYGKKAKYCNNENSIKPASYIIIINDRTDFGKKPSE